MIKKFFIFSLLINIFTSVRGQTIFSTDTIVCNNYIDTLVAAGADQDSISGDDDYSDLIQIGFPFTFYGNTYNSLVICDNGYLTFDAYQANNFGSGFTINAPVPNPYLGPFPNNSGPNNAIMAPWHDVCLNGCFNGQGSVFTSKTGIFPNRKFIATWCFVSMYSCTDSVNTFQIVLHEGSNKVETFLDTKKSCSFNNGAAVHGLVDATSTNFDIVIDPLLGQPRNFPLLWTASNEGWEFLPNGPTSYDINQITFLPITAGVATWKDVNGNVLGVGPDLPVSLSTSTVIYAYIKGQCADSTIIDSVTIMITSPNIELGPDLLLACNSNTILNPILLGGISPYTYIWNTGSVDSVITVGQGVYNVEILDSVGCKANDTIIVTENPPPTFDFGVDYSIPCNTTTIIDPNISGGVGPYSYSWNDGSSDSLLIVSEGIISLEVSDINNCKANDQIIITQDLKPQSTISGGGSICDDGTTTSITFTFNGLLPWDLSYTNGSSAIIENNILYTPYILPTSIAGNYEIIQVNDINDCIADTSGGKVEVIVNPLPIPIITPSEVVIYVGNEVGLTAGSYAYYEWYTQNDSLISFEEVLTVENSGKFYIWVEDINGCADTSALAIVNVVPLTNLFIPNTFTPNGDDHNEFFVIQGNYINSFNIKIYNKWGAELFGSDSIYKYWDGTFENRKVQQGTYFYVVEVIGEDENLFKKSGLIEVLY